MINVHGIRRNVKNVVRNYTDAQKKVREATSNDPWGPSGTLMSEIADLTYNVVAFSEIMQVIWKRLNDHGKNWKHVYKALVLLEYLIKTGSERVTQQCKENIFAIQTLKDFQHIEENKDQGMNVREKAKQLVSLLKDDEHLKNERARALKARERFAQATSHVESDTFGKFGTSSYRDSHNSLDEATSPKGVVSSELESARPQTAGEEELQLQLALAMSKEEAEQEERLKRNDDLRLQMAINESEEDFRRNTEQIDSSEENTQMSSFDDLLGLNLNRNANSIQPQHSESSCDSWGMEKSNIPEQPWNSPSLTEPKTVDPWSAPTSGTSPELNSSNNLQGHTDTWNNTNKNDPWSPKPNTTELTENGGIDELDVLTRTTTKSPDIGGQRTNSPNPFDMTGLKKSLSADSNLQSKNSNDQSSRKTPQTFLGDNSNLVNLDALVSSKPSGYAVTGNTNPFSPASYNPFQAAKPPPPTINQLRAQNQFSAFSATPAPQLSSSGLSAFPVSGLEPVYTSSAAPPPESNPFM